MASSAALAGLSAAGALPHFRGFHPPPDRADGRPARMLQEAVSLAGGPVRG